MSNVWTLVAWTCMGLVALPMSPCALLPRICALMTDAASDADPSADAATPPRVRSCCSEKSDDRGTAPHKKPASPCPQGCCRLAQIGPTVDKVIVTDSLWGVTYLSGPSMEAHGAATAPAQEAHLPAQTLQTLSCLWRC